MYVCHILKSRQTCPAVDAGRGVACHAVRGFCANPCRWRGGGLCAVAAFAQCRASALGARPFVCQRGGGALSAGGGATVFDGASVTPRRGFGRDGRRLAQWRLGRCGGRGLGCAILSGFYRHAAAGAAGRGDGGGLLVDPARCHARFKCGAQPVAGGVAAIGIARGRPAGTGRCVLAGGFVPVAVHRARHMGGAL